MTTGMLSEHFSIAEFEHSDEAIARGIPNKMSGTHIAMAKHTAVYLLENVRKHLNIKYASDKHISKRLSRSKPLLICSAFCTD